MIFFVGFVHDVIFQICGFIEKYLLTVFYTGNALIYM